MCGAFDKLSPREREVVALVAKGRRNKEIARELGPGVGKERRPKQQSDSARGQPDGTPASEGPREATVKEYLRRIFQKVGVENRTELATLWNEHTSGHGLS
jgi:DNA-binding NarL/FixJ family response regulator